MAKNLGAVVLKSSELKGASELTTQSFAASIHDVLRRRFPRWDLVRKEVSDVSLRFVSEAEICVGLLVGVGTETTWNARVGRARQRCNRGIQSSHSTVGLEQEGV